MQGISVSHARAGELAKTCEIYFDPATGFWVRVDNLPNNFVSRHVRCLGDEVAEIPAEAFLANDWFELTLREAAQEFNVPYQTLMSAVREGRLAARQSSSTWLVSRKAVKRFLERSKA